MMLELPNMSFSNAYFSVLLVGVRRSRFARHAWRWYMPCGIENRCNQIIRMLDDSSIRTGGGQSHPATVMVVEITISHSYLGLNEESALNVWRQDHSR